MPPKVQGPVLLQDPQLAVVQPMPMSSRCLSKQSFFAKVAGESNTTCKQVQELTKAIQRVVVAELNRGASRVNLPGICSIRVRKEKARKECVKTVFGKQVHVPSREERKTLRASPANLIKNDFAALR